MFISRKRLKRLESDVEGLRKELNELRHYCDVNREGERYGYEQPSLRDLYEHFERGHVRISAVSSRWVEKAL